MLLMFYDDERGSSKKRLDGKPPGSLDLFDQPEMEQFFTKGVRGRQSFIAQGMQGEATIQNLQAIIYSMLMVNFSISLHQDKLWD